MALDDLLPLTPAVYRIMLALVDGERHGYAILRALAATADPPSIGPTTLYRSLHHMRGAGFIAVTGERPDPALDNERRAYYRLTDLGKRVFAAETERIVCLARAGEAARERLRRPGLSRAASPVPLRVGGA